MIMNKRFFVLKSVFTYHMLYINIFFYAIIYKCKKKTKRKKKEKKKKKKQGKDADWQA